MKINRTINEPILEGDTAGLPTLQGPDQKTVPFPTYISISKQYKITSNPLNRLTGEPFKLSKGFIHTQTPPYTLYKTRSCVASKTQPTTKLGPISIFSSLFLSLKHRSISSLTNNAIKRRRTLPFYSDTAKIAKRRIKTRLLNRKRKNQQLYPYHRLIHSHSLMNFFAFSISSWKFGSNSYSSIS